MAYTPPKYPKELTDRNWQSHKGLIAKIKTKDDGTGIGKMLMTLEKAFKDIKFDAIDFEKNCPGFTGSRSQADIAEGVARAKAACQYSDKVSKLAREVEEKATKLAATWKADKLMPRSSTEAAATVAKQAKLLSYALAMGTVSQATTDGLKAEKAAAEKRKQELRKIVGMVPGKLEALVVDVQKGVDLKAWPGFWKQNVRFIGTQLKTVEELHPLTSPEVTAFRKHASTCNPVKDQGTLDGWLRELETAATSMRRKMG